MPKDNDPGASQPHMMRRTEYACDEDWIRAFLSRVPVGYIATQSDSQPFITAMNFWYNAEPHEIIVHSSNKGRLHINMTQHDLVCFQATLHGKLLPSNIAMEFSIQYESVVAFGKMRMLDDESEKQNALYGLIRKYFPEMTPGVEYRPITTNELMRTTVYAITIDHWSGKRNWAKRAKQSPDWQPLDERWFV